MTDEWEPLPPRASKKSRRHAPAATSATTTTTTPASTTTTNSEGSADAAPNATPAPSRHAAPDDAHMEKMTSAVEERALQQRGKATRTAKEDNKMGNDGVAGEFYEYLDHTADVQLHAWGPDLKAAFEHIVPCMMNYMTDLSTVQVDPALTQTFEVEGHDLDSLLFAWLDEFLFRFSSESFVCKNATILAFDRPPSPPPVEGQEQGAQGQQKLRIEVRAEGEAFSLSKHPQGTEVKAITYSAMQIHEKEDRADLYVIIDI